MSEFKVGDDVLVRGTVSEVSAFERDRIRIKVFDFGCRWLPLSDVLSAAVDPQPVDPSTLRVGDRVRAEWDHVRCGRHIPTSITGEVVEIDPEFGPMISGNYLHPDYDARVFLLSRPVDPRREAVAKAVRDMGGLCTLTSEEVADAILTAIDGVTQR